MSSDQADTTAIESVESRIQELLRIVTSVKVELSLVCTQLKDLDKAVKKERRASQQAAKKTSDGSAKRKPTGFAVPGAISDELAVFMGVKTGTKVARTEVTKSIVKYIGDNGLQNPADKRVILPDQALCKLLDSKDCDEVTYFNLQKFLNHHFV